MARPKRGNYATGEAGLARYKEALRKYLAKTKKTEVKKPEVKKPVAKKPVAKKPATKKPAAKKPVAKKPLVKKPVAKKPAVKKGTAPKKTANNLKIKKTANTAVKTTKQAIKKATPVVKKVASTVRKKAGEAKQAVDKKVSGVKKALNKKSPVKRPTTTGQKLASKANKALQKAGKYAKGPLAKNVGSKLKAIGKGIAKDPKSVVKGAKGAGASILAEKLSTALVNRASKTVFGKERLKRGKELLADVRKNPDKYERTALGYRLKGTGPKKSPITKKTITKKTNNTGLKTKKTERSSRKNTNKDYNAPTATKKADKRFSTFRVDPTENRNLQLERQKGNTETYSRKLSPQAKKTKKAPVTSKPKKMSAIEKRNRQRFGDAHVDRLKIKNKEFQSIKRIKDRKERKKKREEYRQKYGR